MHNGLKMDLKNYFIQKKHEFHHKFAPKKTWVQIIFEKKYFYYFFFNFIVNAPINLISVYYKVPIVGLVMTSVLMLASLAIFKTISVEHKKLSIEHSKRASHHFDIWFDAPNKSKEDYEIFIKCSLIFDIINMTERLKNKDMFENFKNMQKAEKDLFLLDQNKYDYFPHLVKSFCEHLFHDSTNLYKERYSTYQIKMNSELREIYFNLLNNYVNNFYETRKNKTFELKISKSEIKVLNDHVMFDNAQIHHLKMSA
jgi:hypothetical protein